MFYGTYKNSVTLEQWQNGIRGNGFIKCFAAWFENPGYDDTHRITQADAGEILASLTDRETSLIERYGPQKITPGRLAWRRRKLAEPHFSGDEEKFDQEYPHSMESAFLASGAGVFDQVALALMEIEQREKTAPRTGKLENGVFIQTSMVEAWLRVWEGPMAGMSYLMSCDFMEGEESAGKRIQDCHAVGVWRAAYVDAGGTMHKAKLVAAIKPECRVNMDILIGWIADMYRYYGECMTVPEVNSAFGIVTLLSNAGVANLWLRTDSEEQRRVGEGKRVKKRGWLTTEPLREQIISNAQRYIREREVEILCPRAHEEFSNFITLPSGRKEAAGGHHDDWVMMSAIGLHCLPAATRYAVRMPVVHQTSHLSDSERTFYEQTGAGEYGSSQAWG